MPEKISSVAIIGGGPAGAALGARLAAAGRRVAIFDPGKRPSIVVGESLVPAAVPFLRDLGIEDEVRAYSTYKPGATFVLGSGGQVRNLRFDEIRGARTSYSYNAPRDLLDASILRAAQRSGAVVVRKQARLERESADDREATNGSGIARPQDAAQKGSSGLGRVRLSEEDVAAAAEVFGGRQPDFVVDASGRRRMIARLLDLPSKAGSRRDVALHAHLEGVGLVKDGNVHADVLETGWAWRIPLPGKVSVGLVMSAERLAAFGSSIEEQFDNYLAYDPVIRQWGEPPRRVTPVFRYSNYQLVSERAFGDNWALLGDAFGFVDPVFSSGMVIGLDGAEMLSKALLAGGSPAALARYEAHVRHHLEAWQRVVSHYYNGRLFTLFQMADLARTFWIGRVMDLHFGRYLPRVFTGEASNGRYAVWLLDFMCRRGLANMDPAILAVR